MNATSTSLRLGDHTADREYRSILSFNTSSLPDTAVITKVTLKVKHYGIVGTNPFTTHGALKVDIHNGAFSNNNALQLIDFNAAASSAAVGEILNALVNRWYSKTWTDGISSFINRTGVTQFRMRFAKDDNDDGGADYLMLYSGNAASADRPQLIVEYYVP